jgi:hypothetical protein
LARTSGRRPLLDQSGTSSDSVSTLIYNDDRSAIEEICSGPDDRGGCPRATAGRSAACADKWISANGWDFKVAPDTDGCPLVALGIVRRYLQATVADDARERGKDSDADRLGQELDIEGPERDHTAKAADFR